MDWRESNAMDGKRQALVTTYATIHGTWISAIPAGMTG
jgi:hypothetical protein